MNYIFFQSVADKSKRIEDEEVKCKHMAELAQHDLDEALPALEEAMRVNFFQICIVQYLQNILD